MPANFLPSGADYIRFLPELIMSTMGTVMMVLEGLAGEEKERKGILFGHLTLATLIASLGAAIYAQGYAGKAFSGMLIVDGYATFFKVLVLVVGMLTVLSSYQYLRREDAEAGEYHALILFSLVGQCIMASANELIMVFIGLETSSIATYILAGYLRDDKRNNESALKYFLLGSFATAFLLYGIAWIYGAAHTTHLDDIQTALGNRDLSPNLVMVGTAAALMFVGFAFKISAAPFQVWAPDVYQGAPAPVTAFMSAGPKAAAFAAFVRVFMTAFSPIIDRWEPFMWSSALLTMIIGNFAALMQSNIKRLLAYSSIAHAGYVMVAIAAHNEIGISAVMFYLAAYALMNIGAFAVVAHFARQGEKYVNVEDLSGLGWKQPVTAALFAIFLLSFIGVPLTGGFFGKFYIFKAALDAHLVWLSVLGLLNSAVAAYYYLRILVVMYMNEPGESMNTLQPLSTGVSLTLWAAALGTLVLGIFPSTILSFARSSSALIK
ncbi:MAG: NADH-quinone oxidoreductase subunit N [Acidobacteriaceae bacterium]|nr:NADH-quinone oxidoreductase subunit N [Acidobacteriaceae bacterium]